MAGNHVLWQAPVVEDLLQYFNEKIQAEGRHLVFRVVHHEECAQKINAKFGTNFTHRQVYHKFHKLKSQWKTIMQAKSLSGANFDEVEKKIMYDQSEVVRMANDKDPRAKFINVPIHCYDEMEFIFQDKHATGEFNVLQTPYDYPSNQEADLICDKNPHHDDVDPNLQYDSDCIPEQEDSDGGGSSNKHPTTGKADKGKRIKRDDGVIKEVTHVLRDMADTMRFTHVSNPNEELFKTIDGMEEYPLFVRLDLQEYLANNEKTAAMLKGRPLEAIKEYAKRWFMRIYPSTI